MGWGFRRCVVGLAAAAALLGGSGAHASKVSEADELRCLALNIYHEARGEPEAGRMAVAAVTLNRVRHRRYPNTICGVVWQKGQFSWTNDGRSDKPRELRTWKEVQRLARRAYDERSDHQLGRAIYFHSVVVSPHWAKRRERVAQVGRHVFYR